MQHPIRKLPIFLILLLVVVLVTACGREREEPAAAGQAQSAADTSAEVALPAGDAAKGKELFATTCAACHGPAGEGVQGLGKDMTSSEFIASLSDAELLDFIKKGRDPSDPLNTTGVLMPPKGGNPAITDAQLIDIIAYIRSIHK